MRIENPLLALQGYEVFQSREDFSDSLGALIGLGGFAFYNYLIVKASKIRNLPTPPGVIRPENKVSRY